MYASTQTTGEMTWHYENRSTNSVLCHLCDYQAWKYFNGIYPIEASNIQLGLCSNNV